MKKKLCFFCRAELTHLYGALYKYLHNDYELIYVAYSDTDAAILIEQYRVKVNVSNFKNIVTSLVIKTSVTEDVLAAIDQEFIQYSAGMFGINSALRSDRASALLKYEESLKLLIIYYDAWIEIFNGNYPDYFFHEPVSLLMNQTAAILVRKNGGQYLTFIAVDGLHKFNFLIVDGFSGTSPEIMSHNVSQTSLSLECEAQVKDYLTKFRGNYEVLFSNVVNSNTSIKRVASVLKRSFKKKMYYAMNKTKFTGFSNLIEKYLYLSDTEIKKITNQIKYKKIQYDELPQTDKYYFYPLHLEPEAVVLYWAGGYFNNQVNLIENIAASLPPKTYLVVKDHPHVVGYRDVIDYQRLQKIPNILLISPYISGRRIIRDAIGVITINGTAGFEALLNNKHVIVFGGSFYFSSSRVKKVNNVKDIREVLYSLKDVKYVDDEELYSFVNAYLGATKEGFISFYSNYFSKTNISLDENAKIVAQSIIQYISNSN